jgi:hypothetical protein
VLIWYIFTGFGITHQEKSGNPAQESLFSLTSAEDGALKSKPDFGGKKE